MKRKPILLKRKPVLLERTERIPVVYKDCCFNPKRVSTGLEFLESCTGNVFLTLPVDNKLNQFRSYLFDVDTVSYILINTYGICDWGYLENALVLLKTLRVPCYVLLSPDLPDELVHLASSYSNFNIIQGNLSTEKTNQDAKVQKKLFDSRSNGAYVKVDVSPIIPGFTKIYDLLEITDYIKNVANHLHFRFSAHDYSMFYVDKFTQYLNIFFRQNKLNNMTVSLCGTSIDSKSCLFLQTPFSIYSEDGEGFISKENCEGRCSRCSVKTCDQVKVFGGV